MNTHQRKKRKLILSLLIGAGMLLVAVGVTQPFNGDEQQASASSDDAPPSDGEASVEEANGELRRLPLVDDDGTPLFGDSTEDPRSPATVTYEQARADGPVRTWEELHESLDGLDWYVDGVNAREQYTGFGWDDVEKWAEEASDVDARVIHVFNMMLSEEEARDKVRDLVGDDADHMPVVNHSAIVNTRGFGDEQMEDFVDNRQMVRVSLAPIVYMDGQPHALRTDAGVFIDCFNIWWVPAKVTLQPSQPGQPPREIVPPSTPPTVPPGPPPTTPPTTVPPTSPPTTVPPTTPPTTVPGGKDAALNPVSSDPNDPDERVRPVETTAPETVIRPEPQPGSTTTTQAPPPPTIPPPPEVSDPEPINPGVPAQPPATGDPAETCDNDGDGIPDDNC